MVAFVDKVVLAIGYIGAFIGVWLFTRPMLVPAIKRSINLSKKRNEFKKVKAKRKSKLYRHIELLLSVVFNDKSTYAVMSFFGISAALVVIASAIASRSAAGIPTKIIIILIAAFTPYLILRVILHGMRIEASYEAEEVITELNNQYKINHLNMIEAADITVGTLRKSPHSKKALRKLAMQAKQYKKPEELDDIILEFTFAINTHWSQLLANNISLSIEYGDDVTESLNDVLEEVKEIKKMIESGKQQNSEAFLMIKVVTPALYFLSVVAAIKFFGFTLKKFIDYQIYNSMGSKFFILVIGSIVFNYIVYLAVKKPKYDF